MEVTNIDQSYHLLRLGLELNTSDLCWVQYGFGEEFKLAVHVERECEDWVPAWSVSALMKVMQDVYPELLGDADGTWFCRCDKVESEYCDNQITAVYDVVCWLLDHKELKQAEDNDRSRI